jgi:hypothetical protein
MESIEPDVPTTDNTPDPLSKDDVICFGDGFNKNYTHWDDAEYG